MIGRKINNYEVAALIGAGGMGAVYLARHPLLDRRVAIKILRPEYTKDPVLVHRFINEARAANAIRHPNIIEVLDVGVLPDGPPYLFMELLEGEPLSHRIARLGRLPVDEALAIAAEAALALAAAHAKGIVHRDLKPDNLFLARDERLPDSTRVKVLDFGVAKLRRELSAGSYQTNAGVVLGTPIYMSPEQGKGISADVDHRTDVYALGIILYEMLTGRPPFAAQGFGEMVVLHATEPPRPPRELNPDIPPTLEAIILRALAKKPTERIESMDELRKLLAVPAGARIPPPPLRARATPMPVARRPEPPRIQTAPMDESRAASPAALVETAGVREEGPPLDPRLPRTLPLPGAHRPPPPTGRSPSSVSPPPKVLEPNLVTLSLRQRRQMMIVGATVGLTAVAVALALVLRAPAPAPLPADVPPPTRSVLPPLEEPAPRALVQPPLVAPAATEPPGPVEGEFPPAAGKGETAPSRPAHEVRPMLAKPAPRVPSPSKAPPRSPPRRPTAEAPDLPPPRSTIKPAPDTPAKRMSKW